MKTRSDKLFSARELLQEDNKRFVSSTLIIPDGANQFKIDSKKPRNIDLIPYIVGKGNPNKDEGESALFLSYFVHYDVGPEKKPVLCPKSHGDRCPICEEYERLSWPDKKTDEGKSLQAKKRQLWNIIDCGNRSDGIQLWDISFFLFGRQLEIADLALDDGDPRQYYADPTEGFTLRLTISEGSGGGRSWFNVDRVDFNPRSKQYKESIKRKAWCLDDVLKPALPYKELKNLFLQTSDDGEDSNESGNSHSHERNGSSMKRKQVTAKSQGIKEGSTVEHPDLDECTVLKVSKDGYTLTLEDADGDEHPGIGVNEVEVVEKKSKAKGKAAAKKTPAKKGKKVEVDDEDESDDSELEDEEESEEDSELEEEDSEVEEDEESEDSEIDEEEEESEEDSEIDEEEEDSEMEEEEEEPAPKKKGRPAAAKKKSKK